MKNKLKLIKIFTTLTLSFSLALLVAPFYASALVTGGGYQMYEQVTAINDTSTGGGYSLRHSGNTIQGYAAGGGFSILNGGSPSFSGLTVVVPVVTPAPSGGGGGGGGSIVTNPNGSIASTTPINNLFQNQSGNQNQKTDYSNDFRADITDSGKVDILDFNTLMTNWGKRQAIDLTLSKKDRCPTAHLSDISCDGKIDVLDFNLLLVYWGQYIGNEGILLKSKIKN